MYSYQNVAASYPTRTACACAAASASPLLPILSLQAICKSRQSENEFHQRSVAKLCNDAQPQPCTECKRIQITVCQMQGHTKHSLSQAVTKHDLSDASAHKVKINREGTMSLNNTSCPTQRTYRSPPLETLCVPTSTLWRDRTSELV